MARATSAVLLVFGLLILSVLLVSAITVPDVPEPTCVGGWNARGEYVPREQGGCCSGMECCQYAAFKDNPLCAGSAMPSCSGLDCCKYAEYKNTPLCVVSPTPAPTPSEDDCTGLDCCQYEKYKNTSLCLVTPPPSEDDCAKSIPPQCPVGGVAPMLTDPGITSGSKCRGACGGDCPSACTSEEDRSICIADNSGKCFYVCTYKDVISCGSHLSCRIHDDCYDACAEEKGEKAMCWQLGWCHCGCDLGCAATSPPWDCIAFAFGGGPNDKRFTYSSEPIQAGPLRGCPG